MKILVLEDSPGDFLAIQDVLSQDGFQVFHAPNSRQVFNILEKENIDLIVLDIRLEKEEPEDIEQYGEINGITVAERIFEKKRYPVVFLTFYIDEKKYSDAAQQLGIPARYYLPKTYLSNPDVFIRTLEEAVEEFSANEPEEALTIYNRKIGIRHGQSQEISFFDHGEILCIVKDEDIVTFHLLRDRPISIATALVRITRQLLPLFPNFIKLGGSTCVNLDRIKRLDGRKLYFDNDKSVELNNAEKIKLKKEIIVLRSRPGNGS